MQHEPKTQKHGHISGHTERSTSKKFHPRGKGTMLNDSSEKEAGDAEAWLLGLKKYFRVHDFSENMKARVATFNLNRKASICWEDLKNMKGVCKEDLSWERFEKYF
jgi:hypothetical protein